MQISAAEHLGRPWRAHEVLAGFTLEDVWALPVHGAAGDFPSFVEQVATFDPAETTSAPARLLWALRDRLGRWLDLGRISAPADTAALRGPDRDEAALVARVPPDLRGTADHVSFPALPFLPLYLTDDEFAAQMSNRTVHGVLHLAWVDRGAGRHQGQLAVYVRPRGLLGTAYMGLIRPFRHWVVYPALQRQMEREWAQR